MEVFHWIRNWLANLFRPKGLHDDLSEEMEHHLSMTIEKKVAEGMDAEIAKKTALREFGAVERIKEECHDAWGTRSAMDVFRDLKVSARLLKMSKGFTIAVMLTLGLCIAGNTIVFSILDEVLGPPSYPEPNRVVEVYNSYPGLGFDKGSANIALLLDYSENTSAFEQLSLVDHTTVNISMDSSSVRAAGLRVTNGFFEMIRVAPLVGQLFGEAHFEHSNRDNIILTESFWRSHFDSNPNIVGESVFVHGRPFTVIGISPERASIHYENLRFFQAWTWNPDDTERLKRQRHMNYSDLWARLNPGVSIEQAEAQIKACDQRFFDQSNRDIQERLTQERHFTKLESYQDGKINSLGSTLYLLQGCVLVVLVIGCINIVNLQLSRSIGRMPEYAMRRSLGASRLAIARQLLVENMILCLGGLVFGLLVSWIGLASINQFLLQDLLPGYSRIEIGVTSIYLACFLSLGIAVALGMFSLLPILRGKLSLLMQEGSRRTTSSPTLKWFRSALVSSQVALSLVLLVGAGLLLQSFLQALQSETGFDSSGVSTISWELSWNYSDDEKQTQFYDRLTQALNQVSGIDSFAYTEHLPSVSGYPNWGMFLASPGEQGLPSPNSTNVTVVGDGYFELLGIPLLEGRYFLPTDRADGVRNVIVDRKFADIYFPGRSPIGQRITPHDALVEETMLTIVGVVEHVKHNGLDRENVVSKDRGRYPLIYYPMNSLMSRREFSALIKSDRNPEELIGVVRSTLREIDPLIPSYMAGKLDDLMIDELNDRRAFLLLVGILGGMAVLLSTVGIYGVLSYDVSQSVREIGLRMAIGSPQSRVLARVFNQGLLKTVFGLLFGLLGAWIFSRYLADYLYQVKPIEPMAYMYVTAFLLLIGLAASYFPARRATRIHPMEALRIE